MMNQSNRLIPIFGWLENVKLERRLAWPLRWTALDLYCIAVVLHCTVVCDGMHARMHAQAHRVTKKPGNRKHALTMSHQCQAHHCGMTVLPRVIDV